MQIEVENLSITFTQDQSEMTALKDVSLGEKKENSSVFLVLPDVVSPLCLIQWLDS